MGTAAEAATSPDAAIGLAGAAVELFLEQTRIAPPKSI
jgi:hypothetical protein